MADEEHLSALKWGVEVWNKWRAALRSSRRESAPKIDLAGADLCKSSLAGIDFSEVELRGAGLSQADLRNANLRKANLVGTNLEAADLTGADLQESRLAFLILKDTKLIGAHLGGATLDDPYLLNGADLSEAKLGLTKILECDLQDVRGLGEVIHFARSNLDIDTIYKSKGKIPESFLRGCGVPESFITQIHSLVGAEDGIQFYSCFISYSSKDDEFARRLHGRMRDAHLRVWFAPEDIQGGQKLHEQLDTAIRVYDKLLIVLSEASLQSEWVMTELRKARKAERQSGKRKLFPVRLADMETLRDWECFDADSGKDLATELREYFIPDFSHWKNHDKFEAAFVRLLKDLRAEERAK